MTAEQVSSRAFPAHRLARRLHVAQVKLRPEGTRRQWLGMPRCLLFLGRARSRRRHQFHHRRPILLRSLRPHRPFRLDADGLAVHRQLAKGPRLGAGIRLFDVALSVPLRRLEQLGRPDGQERPERRHARAHDPDGHFDRGPVADFDVVLCARVLASACFHRGEGEGRGSVVITYA